MSNPKPADRKPSRGRSSNARSPYKQPGPHPAMLDEEQLLKHCDISFGRSGGPGGQHRNKVETACTVTHRPSEFTGTANERRQQSQNRHEAIFRLRLRLAFKLRRDVHRDQYKPSDLWKQRRQGTRIAVNPKHSDYPALLAEALDVIYARNFDVAGAAGVLGVSMSQLAKLVRHHKHAFARVNEGREATGLNPLK